jgi:hypothetical protein
MKPQAWTKKLLKFKARVKVKVFWDWHSVTGWIFDISQYHRAIIFSIKQCNKIKALWFVTIVIEHAKCIWRITVSSVGCPTIPCFCTLSHEHYSYQKKVTKHKMCVLIFSTTFVQNTSYSKKNSVTYYHNCTYAFM